MPLGVAAFPCLAALFSGDIAVRTWIDGAILRSTGQLHQITTVHVVDQQPARSAAAPRARAQILRITDRHSCLQLLSDGKSLTAGG